MNFRKIGLQSMIPFCIGFIIEYKDRNQERILNYSSKDRIDFNKTWESSKSSNY
jgi:hypothetical protein